MGRLTRRRKTFLASLAEDPKLPDGTDARDRWYPLTWREKLLLAPVLMDALFLITYYTGLRDRLRCPRCTAVGTWKMHGTWWERWRYGDIALRRWGCKWCGHWIAAHGKGEFASLRGRTVAFPGGDPPVWRFGDPAVERRPTPAEALFERLGRTWPWLG